jgi:uncharacterized membrane protein
MIKQNMKLRIICTAVLLTLGISVVLSLTGLTLAANNVTATVSGATYAFDNTLKPLNDTLISINSTPPQTVVAKDGMYSFELVPGNYTINYSYYENGTLTYYKEETFAIEDKSIGHDFLRWALLLPVNSKNIEESAKESITGASTAKSPVISNSVNNLRTPATKQSRPYSLINYPLLALTSFFLFLLIGSYLLLRNGEQKEENSFKKEKDRHTIRNLFKRINTLDFFQKNSTKENGKEMRPEFKVNTEEAIFVTEVEPKMQRNMPNIENYSARETEIAELMSEKENRRSFLEEPANNSEIDNLILKKKLLLPSDLQEIIDIIKSQRGLISQKDLRNKLNYSEVKVSVMLTDLEKRKRIKKIKRGRENFIVLRDWKG